MGNQGLSDTTWDLADLIENLRDCSYRELSARIDAIRADQIRRGLVPIEPLHTTSMQQMVKLRREVAIHPTSVRSLAAGLHTSERAVWLATGVSVDLDMSGVDDDVMARLDPRLNLLGPNQWAPFRKAQEEWVQDALRERELTRLRAENEQLKAEIKDARKAPPTRRTETGRPVFRSAD